MISAGRSPPPQLSVRGDPADLLAPPAGDARHLQHRGSIAVGRTHPRRGHRSLPQPDNSQEKGPTLPLCHQSGCVQVSLNWAMWALSDIFLISYRWWRWWLLWWWPLPSAGCPTTSTLSWDPLTSTSINSIIFSRSAAAWVLLMPAWWLFMGCFMGLFTGVSGYFLAGDELHHVQPHNLLLSEPKVRAVFTVRNAVIPKLNPFFLSF